jgi:hypothetical protein
MTGVPRVALDQYHLYNVSTKAGEWISRLNGAEHFRSAANTVGWDSSPSIGWNGGSEYLRGDIAEILIYNKVLTSSEREAVGSYLARKYAFTPFYVLAPNIDSNLNGLPDSYEAGLGFDPTSFDSDTDGVRNDVELAQGTDPFNADTDGDGVNDGLDLYPLDPTASAALPTNPNTTAPVITLTAPASATPLP